MDKFLFGKIRHSFRNISAKTQKMKHSENLTKIPKHNLLQD